MDILVSGPRPSLNKNRTRCLMSRQQPRGSSKLPGTTAPEMTSWTPCMGSGGDVLYRAGTKHMPMAGTIVKYGGFLDLPWSYAFINPS